MAGAPAGPEAAPAGGTGATRARRWLGLAIRLGIAAGLIAWLVASHAIEWSILRGLITRWPLVLAALVPLLVSTFFTAVRLPILLRPLGFELPVGPAISLMLVGLFFGIFLPGSAGGDLAKIYYSVSGQRRGTRAELATAVLFDRAIGMWAMFSVPLLAWPFLRSDLGGGALDSLLYFSATVFVLGGVALVAVMLAPEGSGNRLPAPLRRDVLLRALGTVRSYRDQLSAVGKAFLVSLGAHATAIATAALIAAAVVPQAVSRALALLVPLGFVANALPITPGGLGVGEAAFDRLFHLAGVDGGAEVALGWRMAILALSLVGGLLYVRGFGQTIRSSSGAGAAGNAAQPGLGTRELRRADGGAP